MDNQQAFNRDFAKILETLEELNKNNSFNEEISELQDEEIMRLQTAIRHLCDSNVRLISTLEKSLLGIMKVNTVLYEKCELNTKSIKFLCETLSKKLEIELGENQ